MMISNDDLVQFNKDVVRLCEESTKLHGEIAGQKERFNEKLSTTITKTAEAQKHATAANDYRSSAMNAEIKANSHASRAEIAANRAEKVTGLDTVEQAVAQAMEDADLNIPTEADLKMMIERNRSKYAASGFVEWGYHKGKNVNQGITTYEGSQYWIDAFASGNPDGGGISQTVHPVIHIAGYTINPIGVHRTDALTAFKLPPAPDGTVVFDSSGYCRGTNTALLDLTKDVDPKYGDIAETKNEAVARAFEGMLKNGDFRNGERDWSKSLVGTAIADFSNGQCSITVREGEQNTGQRIVQNVTVEANRNYKFTVLVKVDRADASPRLQLYGFNGNPVISKRLRNLKLNKWHEFTVSYTSVVDGSIEVQMQNNSTTNSTISFSNAQMKYAGEEVVISRQDLVGFEAFLEEITPQNPMVYLGGFIQCRNGNINGVATEEDTTRPPSYFAAFDGDMDSVGKGCNWFALPKAHKELILASPRINIFKLNDGRLVQLRVRQRAFAGMNDKNFVGLNPAVHGSLAFTGTTLKGAIKPQGATNDSTPYTGVSPYFYGSTAAQHKNLYPYERGIFCASQYNGGTGGLDKGLSVDGRVFFLVCAYVQRLNQGAYHPSHNPLGTSRLAGSTDGQKITGRSMWHDSVSDDIRCTARCFHGLAVGDPFGRGGGYCIGHEGSLTVAATGRYDSYKYHDSIYAGIIHDMRLSAHKQDVNKLRDDTIRRAMVGKMRGKEQPYFTWTGKITIDRDPVYHGGYTKFVGASTSSQIPNYGARTQYQTTDEHSAYVRSPIDNQWYKLAMFFTEEDSDGIGATYIDKKHGNVISKFSVSDTTELDVIVSAPQVFNAEFDEVPHVAIVGTYENLAETFPDGVLGQWVNVEPDGTEKKFPLLRKHTGSTLGRLNTTDNGATWDYSAQPNSAQGLDTTTNEVTATLSANTVRLYFVDGLAKHTEPANNSGIIGEVGRVFGTSHCLVHSGCRLQESLISSVGKGTDAYLRGESIVTTYTFTSGNRLYPHGGLYPKHLPINQFGTGTSNNSKAVKALSTIVEKDGQLYLQLHGCEMVYTPDADEGKDKWGDIEPTNSPFEPATGRVPIIDGEGTKTDANGKTVKTFCHHSMFPLAWSSENTSAQTPN
ncbi:carbohydrate binding domain-containing protein [Vibrio parahaemolyticus]|nr:carbohydrate binding domain-containing protein [Vibrio parahaemolyticus]